MYLYGYKKQPEVYDEKVSFHQVVILERRRIAARLTHVWTPHAQESRYFPVARRNVHP
jgi:hypothetical protein